MPSAATITSTVSASPAAAAISTITSTAPTPSTATITSSATASPLAAITTPAAASSATAIFPRLGFVHFEGPAAMLLTVERRNRRLGFLIAAHLDETEPLALASGSIVDYVRAFHCTIRSKQLLQGFVVNVETQISHIQFFTHNDLLCYVMTSLIGWARDLQMQPWGLHPPCHPTSMLMSCMKSTSCGQTLIVPLRRETAYFEDLRQVFLKIFKIERTKDTMGNDSIRLLEKPEVGEIRWSPRRTPALFPFDKPLLCSCVRLSP